MTLFEREDQDEAHAPFWFWPCRWRTIQLILSAKLLDFAETAQTSISATSRSQLSMRRGARHWPLSTPISISTMLSQLAMLGRVVELKPPEHAPRFGRWECGVDGSGVGGEVVEDDADALGLREVDIDEFAHAKGRSRQRCDDQ